MRLLLRSNTGEFSLTKEFLGDDIIPPYAILSHTWREGEEVTFKDLIYGTGQDKAGYKKIQFCGKVGFSLVFPVRLDPAADSVLFP
jgi:hypothetical protein